MKVLVLELREILAFTMKLIINQSVVVPDLKQGHVCVFSYEKRVVR